MSGRPKLMPPNWPRMMRKSTAAAYLDMGEAAFQRAVDADELPGSVILGGNPMWSRPAIDERCDHLTGNAAHDWRKHAKFYIDRAAKDEI